MSLHHVRLIHGSEPNPSGQRRIGFAIRYLPTYVRQVAGTHDWATLVRGTDRYGNFELEQRPDADMSPSAQIPCGSDRGPREDPDAGYRARNAGVICEACTGSRSHSIQEPLLFDFYVFEITGPDWRCHTAAGRSRTRTRPRSRSDASGRL